MNNIQYLIDRQLGTYRRFNYDNILKRLVVKAEDSFCALQNTLAGDVFTYDYPIYACRFSEAPGYEHILALANGRGKVVIQDTCKKGAVNKLVKFQSHSKAVFDIAWMPGRKNFVTTSGDNTACLWDVSESAPKKLTVYSSHKKSVKTAVFRPTAPSVFATGAKDSHIFIWDVRTNNTPCVVLKPDNKIMHCHSGYTPKKLMNRQTMDRRDISITGLVFQDDITLLSSGGCDGKIKIWDLRKTYTNFTNDPFPKQYIPYCGSSSRNSYSNLIIDDSRTRLYASCMDNVIYCFNISKCNTSLEQKYIGHRNGTFYVRTSLSPDCMYLASGSTNKNAYIWNVKYSEPIVKLVSHWSEVNCATWCQKGDMKIVTCDDDGRHNMWRIGREFPDLEEKLKGKANEWKLLQAGMKRNSENKRYVETSPAKKEFLETHQTISNDSRDTAPIGRKSCMSHLKSYNITNRKLPSRSPKSPKSETSRTKSPNPTPVIVSPTKVRITSFDSPTKDVAKFLLTGEAPHLKPKLLQAGMKRNSGYVETSPAKKEFLETDQTISNDSRDIAPIGRKSSISHLKPYDKTNPKILSPSPKSPKSETSPTKSPNPTPVIVSPTKVRITSFDSPTKDVANFLLTGEAPHLKPKLLQAGMKHNSGYVETSPAKKEFLETDQTISNDSRDIAPIGRKSSISHLKPYDKTNPKILSPSPKSPKSETSSTKSPNPTPVKMSPTKVRITSFDSPTKDLPNFILTGEAPHLIPMPPLKKKQNTKNWLTLMVEERKAKAIVDKSPILTPNRKKNVSSRRISKTKCSEKSETILKYFSRNK